MKRRTLLAGAGITALLPLTGCLSSFSEQEVELDYINIGNRMDESVTVDVRLDWDGEEVYAETVEIGEDSFDLLDEWPDEPAQWEVFGRIRGEEWTSISSDDADADLVAARGFIGDTPELALAWALLDTSSD